MDKTFISGSNMPSSNIITSPSNAKYVRVSVQKNKTNYVFCEGETYTGYNDFGYLKVFDIPELADLDERVDTIEIEVSDISNALTTFSYETTESSGYLIRTGVVDNAQTNFHYLVTNKITVSEGDKYKYTGRGEWSAMSWVMFNGSTVVDYSQSTTTTEVTIPAGVNGIIFSSFEIVNSGNEIVLVVKKISPQSLNSRVTQNEEDIATLKNNLSPLNGIKIDIIGDSWSAVNGTASVKYTDLLQSVDGANVSVVAYSGAGYHKPTSDNKPFYAQALSVRSDADIVFIFGSFNDVSDIIDGTSIGDITDTGTSTICGCINTTIDNVISINPSAKIIVGGPGAWRGYNANNDNNNTNNNVALQYVDAIKNVCYKRGYEFIDFLRSMNLKPWIEAFRTAYQPDGTHPNNAGHLKYVYPRVKALLKTYI